MASLRGPPLSTQTGYLHTSWTLSMITAILQFLPFAVKILCEVFTFRGEQADVSMT